ncbi:MAG TPA: DinB family protein [Gemmatimonadaceae bacterium]|nr:DinB family protein [Gemmatimonadaceae bacterium]
MTSTVAPAASLPAVGAAQSEKQRFLEVYEIEHAKTMRVLRAFPPAQAELRPHDRCKTARELAWIFALERGLGKLVFNDAFASGVPSGEMPPAPESWDAILAAIEQSHREFGDLVKSLPDEKLHETVKFLVAPKTLGDVRRTDFAWFLLHDEIHHRGQMSVYLRMAGGKVPSIYGPSADEPWM